MTAQVPAGPAPAVDRTFIVVDALYRLEASLGYSAKALEEIRYQVNVELFPSERSLDDEKRADDYDRCLTATRDGLLVQAGALSQLANDLDCPKSHEKAPRPACDRATFSDDGTIPILLRRAARVLDSTFPLPMGEYRGGLLR